MLLRFILKLYEGIFAKTYFYKLNKFLFYASAQGLGISNSETYIEKAEKSFLHFFFTRFKTNQKALILDVGGNIGDFSEKIIQHHSEATIYAFEPHPGTFKKLEASALKHGYHAIPKGCSESSGKIKFFDYANSSGTEHATMLKEVIEDIHHSKAQEIEVDTIAIDDFLSEKKIQEVNLLKIDTEGFELNVLKGAQKALNSNNIEVVYFEFNSMNTVSRVFMRDFAKLLKDYKLFRTVPNGLIPVDLSQQLLSEVFMFQNIVAIHTLSLNKWGLK